MKKNLLIITFLALFSCYGQTPRFVANNHLINLANADSVKILTYGDPSLLSIVALDSSNTEAANVGFQNNFIKINDSIYSVATHKLHGCGTSKTLELRQNGLLLDELIVEQNIVLPTIAINNVKYIYEANSYDNLFGFDTKHNTLGLSFSIDTQVDDTVQLGTWFSNEITTLTHNPQITYKVEVFSEEFTQLPVTIQNTKVENCPVSFDTTINIYPHTVTEQLKIDSVTSITPSGDFLNRTFNPYFKVKISDELDLADDIKYYLVEISTDTLGFKVGEKYRSGLDNKFYDHDCSACDPNLKDYLPENMLTYWNLGGKYDTSLSSSNFKILVPKTTKEFLIDNYYFGCNDYFIRISAITDHGAFISKNHVKFNGFTYAKINRNLEFIPISFNNDSDTVKIFNAPNIMAFINNYPDRHHNVDLYDEIEKKNVNKVVTMGLYQYSFKNDEIAKSKRLYKMKISPYEQFDQCTNSDSIYIQALNVGAYYKKYVNGQNVTFKIKPLLDGDYGFFTIVHHDTLFSELISSEKEIMYSFPDTGTYGVDLEYRSLKYNINGVVSKSNTTTFTDLEAFWGSSWRLYNSDTIYINTKSHDCGVSFASENLWDGTFRFDAIKPINDTSSNVVWTFPEGQVIGNTVIHGFDTYGWNRVKVQYNQSDTCHPQYSSSVYNPDLSPCPNVISYTQNDNSFVFSSEVSKSNTFGTYSWQNKQGKILGYGKEFRINFSYETINEPIYCVFVEQSNYCNSVDTVFVSVSEVSHPSYDLSGTVHAEFPEYVKYVNIAIVAPSIVDPTTGYSYRKTTVTDGSGNFVFEQLPKGTSFYLWLSPPLPMFENTYYDVASEIYDAKLITMDSDKQLDINLLERNEPLPNNTWNTGTSVIRGIVTFSLVNPLLRTNEVSQQLQALPGSVVELYDTKNNLLTRTMANNLGEYEFHNLAEGSYVVKTFDITKDATIELPVTTKEALVPFLSSNIVLKPRVLTHSEQTIIVQADNGVQYFPNPVSESLTIGGLDFSKDYTVTLYNSQGASLRAGRIENLSQYIMDTQALATGLYVFTLHDGSLTQTLRFVKE